MVAVTYFAASLAGAIHLNPIAQLVDHGRLVFELGCVALLVLILPGRRRRRKPPYPYRPLARLDRRSGTTAYGRWHARRLFMRYQKTGNLADVAWDDFERLVAETFRRWGYKVDVTGLGGADGGVDLRARKAGKTTLIQCKHWRSASVGEPQVREMFGLMHHYRADAVAVVTSGRFTRTAWRFADGKAIELIDGRKLSRMANGDAT